MFLDRD